MFKNLVSLVFMMVLVIGNVLASEFKVSKPFVQFGHGRMAYSVAVTPDGKYALSGGVNKIILWNIKTTKEIRTFRGHSSLVTDVAVSLNGKYVVSGSWDKVVKLWDIRTGQELRSFIGHKKEVTSVAITSNNKYIFSGDEDGVLIQWDVETGEKIKVFNGPVGIKTIYVDVKNKYMVSGGYEVIKLWDIVTGKEIKTFKADEGFVRSVVLSSDGNYVFSGGDDKSIKQWDIKTGQNIRTFSGHESYIHSVVITPDGKNILSGSSDKTIKLWDINKGQVVKTFKGHTRTVNSLVMTTDGNHILSGSGDKTLKLWDIVTGQEIKTFKGDVSSIRSAVMTPDGKITIFGSDDNTLKLWDINKGQEIITLKGHVNNITSVAITSDGRYALSGSWDKTLKLWNINTGQVIRTFKGHKSAVTTVAITSDGKYVLSGSDDGALKLWDINTAEEIRTFIGHKDDVNTIAITPDGKYILSGSADNTIKLWDVNTGQNIRNFNGHELSVNAVAITSDGQYLLSGAGNYRKGILKLWDIQTAKEIKTFKGDYYNISSIAISSDNRYALLGIWDGTSILLDINTGKQIKIFSGHANMVNSVVFSPNNQYVMSASQDGTVRYWDINSGKELLTTISFLDDEWLSITPEGYFNASKNGAKHLNILTGPMEVSSIDQYYETFYRPDIVASVMSDTKDIQYATPKPTLKLPDVKPAPQVAIIDTKESINKEELKVTLRITPSSGGIGQIRLYIDGVLIKTDGDRGLQKKQNKNIVLKTYTIKLLKGKHTIKAIVYNEANTMASREDTLAVTSTYSKMTKPNIYAVVIGINEYKNPAIALKYAVADAELFAKTIKKRTKGLYGDVKVELLTTKETTSKEYITKTLKNLENISPNDLFIFFVASHGMIEDAKYHMITSNVGALSTRGIKREAISQNSLRDLVANIPTTKKFIILDTCNSGALGEAIEVALLTRGLTETTAMKVLSRAVGSTIISASSSSQEALEGYKGHGLLTYVLTDGLNGKADGDRDGYIKTLEIANFVEDTVPEIAEKEFNRAQYPFVSPLGQGFPLVKVK